MHVKQCQDDRSPNCTSSHMTLSEQIDPAKTNARVYIVIVDYNGREDTLKCLQSLRELQGGPIPTIIVNNGSTCPIQFDEVQDFDFVHLVNSDDNLGWAGGNNLGINRALELGAQQVLLLNNDTIVSRQIVSTLLSTSANHPEFGILGCIVCYMDEPNVVNMDGCQFFSGNEMSFFIRQPVIHSSDGTTAVTATDIVFGCCMLINKEVFTRIGYIDENFFLIHEESDFCLRASRHGFLCGIVNKTLVWHKGSSSFSRDPRPLQFYYDIRNLYKLLKKHPVPHNTIKSWRCYFMHVYYMYCLAYESGGAKNARYVSNGLHDALLNQYGRMPDNFRPLSIVISALFNFARISRKFIKFFAT